MTPKQPTSLPAASARKSVDPVAVLRSLAAKGIPPARLSDANLRDLGVTREQLAVAGGVSAPAAKTKTARAAKAETKPAAVPAVVPVAGETPKEAPKEKAKRAPKKPKKVLSEADLAARPPLEIDPAFLPAWCLPHNLFFKIRFDVPSPSNNVIKSMHFAAYKKLRESFERQVREALGGYSGPRRTRVAMVIERFSEGAGLDWDNAYGGLKPMFDTLVAPSLRNPSGQGLIADDSLAHVPIPPFMRQEWAPKGQGYVDVYLFDLAGVPDEVLTRYARRYPRPEPARKNRKRTTPAGG